VQATGPSMLPTLNAAHDWLVVEKVSVWRNRIEVGAALADAQHSALQLCLPRTRLLGHAAVPALPSSDASSLLCSQIATKRRCGAGDVVLALSPRNPTQRIIKRVLGMDGDTVRVESSSRRGATTVHTAR